MGGSAMPMAVPFPGIACAVSMEGIDNDMGKVAVEHLPGIPDWHGTGFPRLNRNRAGPRTGALVLITME